MPYAEIFEAFPSELRLPIARLVDTLKAECEVRRADSEALQVAVQGLTAAQTRTEARVEQLATAQTRTESRLAELAVAQARTEARVDGLTMAVEELTQAQLRTE